MTYIVGFISQKGGSGKSTLARLLAWQLAKEDYTVKIADMDLQQLTCTLWSADRGDQEPSVPSQSYSSLKLVLKEAPNFDAILIDGKANASTETMDIGKAADLIVIPSKTTKDDMRPNVMLAHKLVDAGIPVERIVFVMSQTTGSEADLRDARAYITGADYEVLEGSLEAKTAFGRANDAGKSLAETGYSTLNEKATQVSEALISKLAAVGKKGEQS